MHSGGASSKLPGQPSDNFPEQKVATIPSFELESGVILQQVPIAYKAWGKLSRDAKNCVLVCHPAFFDTDVASWWSDLLGEGDHALNARRFFIVCLNAMGSPFGSASPCTMPKGTSGPTFPLTTVGDDVRIHRMVLESLGVRQICMAVGHSMGGMHVLEWAFQGSFVRTIVPIATTAAQSAWGIAWAEAQRQSIFSDEDYKNGWYSPDNPPVEGLRAARVCGLLTRASKNAVETSMYSSCNTAGLLPHSTQDIRWSSKTNLQLPADILKNSDFFAHHFDANCYIALTRKMDAHDVGRGHGEHEFTLDALASIKQPALIVGVKSDVLHPIQEQQELAEFIPNGRLCVIDNIDGHDAVLSTAASDLNRAILKFQKEVLFDLMDK